MRLPTSHGNKPKRDDSVDVVYITIDLTSNVMDNYRCGAFSLPVKIIGLLSDNRLPLPKRLVCF